MDINAARPSALSDAGLRLKNLLDAVELPRWLTGP